MKRLLPLAPAIIALSLLLGGAKTAWADDPVTVGISQDCYAQSNDSNNPHNNTHLDLELMVVPPYARQLYIQPDLSGLTVTGVVSAMLRLYRYNVNDSVSSLMRIYWVTESWDEDTLTWNTRPQGDYHTHMFMGYDLGWKTINISTYVDNVLVDGDPNYGIGLKWETQHNNQSNDQFYSSSGLYAPYVIIEGVEQQTEWPLSAEVYYPLTEADEWATYQSYSNTTWYGGDYSDYTIWRARPGSSAYPITTLDITDVGQNAFGYYVEGQINVWPDILSTTVRYEGLADVTVSPGQRVGPNCAIGTIAPNPSLYDRYHLLLGVFFPDADTPMDPAPYMHRRPDPLLCVAGVSGPGPGLGEIPDQVLAVCQSCVPPTTWANVGRWIAWLWCQLQNIYLCHFVTWFNNLIHAQVLAVQALDGLSVGLMGQFNSVVGLQARALTLTLDLAAWSTTPVNYGLDWMDAMLDQGINYGAGMWTNTTAQLENGISAVTNIQGGVTTLILDPGGGGGGTNIWDVLVELIAMMRDLITVALALALRLFDFLTSVLDLFLVILSGIMSGLSSSDAVDLVELAMTGDLGGGGGGGDGASQTGTAAFEGYLCGDEGGAIWSEIGPSSAKAACLFVAGFMLADTLVAATLIYSFWIVDGLLLFGVLYWIIPKIVGWIKKSG